MPDEILPLEEDLMSSFSARQAKIINWLDKRPEKGAGDEMSELRAKKKTTPGSLVHYYFKLTQAV